MQDQMHIKVYCLIVKAWRAFLMKTLKICVTFLFCRNDDDETECVMRHQQRNSYTSIHKMVRSVVSINGTKYKVKCTAVVRGVTRGARGAQLPGRRTIMGTPKNPNNVTSTFFNRRFASERRQVRTWGAKLASCPGRHLTSLRPWSLYAWKTRTNILLETVDNSLAVSFRGIR